MQHSWGKDIVDDPKRGKNSDQVSTMDKKSQKRGDKKDWGRE